MTNRGALFIIVLFFVWVHRAPAPIQEENPTPAADQSVKAKGKHTKAEKPLDGKNSAAVSATAAQQKDPFDGTWTGSYKRGWMGETQHTYVISGHGTVLRETIGPSETHVWNPACDGTTMRWNWSLNVAGVSTFTPTRDGRTAVFTVKATGIGGYETSATFHRISP